MSDLKNVLKAGFLLSASLLATGCGDNKSSDTAGNDGGNGSGGGLIPEVNPTVVPSTVRSTKFDLGNFLIHFTQSGQQVNTLPVTVPEAFEGKYDVFKSQKTDQKPDQKPSPLSLQNSLVKISSYKNPKDDVSLSFDATRLAVVNGINLGGLVLDGSIDVKKRYTVPAEIQGDMSTGVLVCRNARVTAADDKSASITSGYTYVGIDAAIGYDFLRQNQDGTEFEVPVGINSQIDESSAAASSATASSPTAMSADTLTVTGLADTPTTTAIKEKLISAATASKSTKASTVEKPMEQKDKAVPSVANVPEASKKGSLKLTTAEPTQLIREKLKSAGIVLLDGHGALDIAGRIATVEAKDTVITALALDHPVLQDVQEVATKTVSKAVATTLPTDTKILEAKEAADKAVAEALKVKTKADKDLNAAEEKYTKAEKDSKQAVDKLNNLNKQLASTAPKDKEAQIAAATKAKTEAETKATAAEKARDDAKAAAKKASDAYAAASNPAAKKTQATAKTVADASKATADKTAATQALINDPGAKKFFFTVKDKGYYAEIGDLTVNDNVVYHANTDHALWVHKLTLKKNLEVHALADLHTFDKLAEFDLSNFVADVNKIDNGQKMMTILQTEGHSTQTSNVAEGNSTKPYLHYDSHTKFPLWVSESVPGSSKLVLKGVDLAPGVSLDTGVYAMPLVKDMSMMLPNSSGNEAITLAKASAADKSPVRRVTEWKIVSNGYADLVLLIKVVGDEPTGTSSDTLNRVLMSADVQAGRSVASSTLAGLVSKLDPSNLVSGSFANLSTSRINQAAQVASLTRGVSAANAEKLGAVEQYNVTFNYAGAQFGLSYNVEGGNAFSSRTGTTSFGANVATDMFGLKAIVSAEASVDAGKNAYAASSVASYNAALTFAKAYSLGGLSVVPMGGLGVSSNALNSYSAVVPMAAGALGLSMNDVSFSAATFHAGVSVALDDAVATVAGANASLTLGVAGYLASAADAKLSTSEGKSFDLQFDGSAVTPYAQFSLGLASGEKINTMISSGIVAINFGLDR